MARKILNRKQLRDEVAAADKAGAGDEKEAKKEKKAPVKRKRKEAAETRVKLFWGVYNQSLKLVAKYEYAHKKQAEQKAGELSANGKPPHFIQKVKEPVVEE